MTRTSLIGSGALAIIAAIFVTRMVVPAEAAKAAQASTTQAAAAAPQQAGAKRAIIPTGGRAGGMLTPGIMVGNTLYLSGQLGTSGRDSGVVGETKAAIRAAQNILTAAGMTLNDVVSVTAYLTDVAEFNNFNTAYREFFTADPRPTRTTVIVKELVNSAKVELTMVAVKAP